SSGAARRRSATTPRTCSAIVARISAMPLLSGVGQLDQLRQFLAGLARVDRLRGQADALLDARRPAADVKRGAAVQQNHVTGRTLVSVQNRSDDARAFFGVAAVEIFERAAFQAELLGLEQVFPDRAVAQLGHPGRTAERNLIQPFEPVHDHRARAAEVFQHLGDHADHLAAVEAEQLVRRHGRIGERPEHIEDRADADVAARLHGVFHRFVKQRREEKTDADFGDARFHPLFRRIDADAERVDAPKERVEACIAKIGIGFLFAPLLHEAMKYAVQPRRDIGIRTIFNMLGPLTNPAMATHQLLGLYSGEMVGMITQVLKNLGSARAMVVHGLEGLDEISLCGPTRVAELRDGAVREYLLEPEQFGLKRCALEDLHGGNPEESARIVRAILDGNKGPARDVVLLNGGAALYVSGRAASIQEGIGLAAESIDSGQARQKLAQLVELTNAA